MEDDKERVIEDPQPRVVVTLSCQTPTEEGKKRWPPNGVYAGEPCTCEEDCSEPCKGECGCQACWGSYADFLSME